jgi:hypothetical protein
MQAARFLALVAALLALPTAGFQFQADEWITECDVENRAGDCAIIGVFRGASREGAKGTFSLAVDLRSGIVAVVGTPYPVEASLRVDRNPPIRCVGVRYCLMAGADSKRAMAQLETGALVLLDVSTEKGSFFLSMTTRGYRAGLSKINAHRHLMR